MAENQQYTARYSRQIMLPQFGEEGQRKLSSAKVLLVGVGGLGSSIAIYLAGAGVGHIGLVDMDIVSESNLQRQVLYKENEIGQSKVACAKKRLLELNSNVEVTCYPCRFDSDNGQKIASKYDLIIDGCDNFATRYLIDEVSSTLQMPYIYGSIGEFRGQVSVFNGQNGGRYRDLYPREDHQPISEAAVKGVLGAVPGVIGALQATEAIKIITGIGHPLFNRLLTVDLLTMDIRILKISSA